MSLHFDNLGVRYQKVSSLKSFTIDFGRGIYAFTFHRAKTPIFFFKKNLFLITVKLILNPIWKCYMDLTIFNNAPISKYKQSIWRRRCSFPTIIMNWSLHWHDEAWDSLKTRPKQSAVQSVRAVFGCNLPAEIGLNT